jgi:hypothetical protein
MPVEYELGALIRRMNPYTNGARASMRLGPVLVNPAAAQAAAAAVQQAATAAANAANTAAAPRAAAVAIAAADVAADTADKAVDLSHIELEVHDLIANYTSAEWTFRGVPQTIKRAIRITYRYELRDAQGNPNGLYATEHVLIGYAGGNGP